MANTELKRDSSSVTMENELKPQQPENSIASIAGWRKSILLFIFCFAQFLDAFNNSALFAAIPPISAAIGISDSNSVWLISAYQLTFAALLLTTGRLSDLYNPKWAFILGLLLMSFSSLGCGFVRSQVPLIILRAIMGIGAALNIPSALAMIIGMYPDPAAQGKALGGFAASATIGNVTGLFIGAALAAFVSWTWIFYLITILSFVMAAAVLVIMPLHISFIDGLSLSQGERFKRLDLVGVSTLTVSLVLLVYSVTTGSIDGWGEAKVLVPLILFFVLVVAFFQWEGRIPEHIAAVPPKMWRYQNFTILIILSLQPFMFWVATQLLLSWYWQFIFDWSTINVAVHFLPLGVISFPMIAVAIVLQKNFSLKWVILMGEILVIAGTLLLPFADSKPHYWRYAFPGFVLGSAGTTVVYATTNIALFAVTPPEVAGIVGAIFNCALQLGAAAGSAIITSIQTSTEKNHGGTSSFEGRAAGFWFMFTFTALEAIGVAIFMKNTVPALKAQNQGGGDQKEQQTESA
ncbi:MFS general substrate transporter [Lentinula edodes]|nr:MFS general substrate transporter [Lentinula edodes]